MMDQPPLEAGAVHDTTEEALAFEVAVTVVGALGAVDGVAGVAGPEAADGWLVPMTLVAVTVKVYVVPLVRPVTVHEMATVVQVMADGDEVTV